MSSLGLNLLQIKPTVSSYINGPDVFQYSIGVLGTYDRELAERLFLNSGVNLILYENITQAVGSNNSTLPHVRSDFSQYYGGSALKLDHLLLNRVYQPSERNYARLSAGYIEQMYGGIEGQWLYVARGTPWAFDLSVDAVKKRAFDGLGFQDYQTVTALAAVHYKLPYQSTLTVRTGKFLARDVGARFEVKRRFRIGIEMGAWYTVTNAVDTGVGSEPNYRDKGVFMSIPFEALLPNDTKITTGFSLAPWTRDVGQMVNSPVDLYDTLEKSLMIDMHKSDGLGTPRRRRGRPQSAVSRRPDVGQPVRKPGPADRAGLGRGHRQAGSRRRVGAAAPGRGSDRCCRAVRRAPGPRGAAEHRYTSGPRPRQSRKVAAGRRDRHRRP
jgi:hypothetical protein